MINQITNEAGETEQKELVENDPLSLRNFPTTNRAQTRKRIRRVKEPHLHRHIVKGKEYFSAVHGKKENYLGDLPFIEEAVLFYREHLKAAKNEIRISQ